MRPVSRVAVALLLVPALARAQQTPAMHAFEEGRTLALQGNCAAAIDKFTQSLTAEPSIGAYLNRAACRAQLGDPAHAWADYAHAEEIALAKGARRDGMSGARSQGRDGPRAEAPAGRRPPAERSRRRGAAHRRRALQPA